MAYNKRNHLEKVVQVQTVYVKHKTPDNTTASVYRNVIKPMFNISLRTLATYLETPAKAQLKELDKTCNNVQS